MPFIEAIPQMPKNAKFLKDLISNRKKLEQASKVVLNVQCSVVIMHGIPTKLRDLGCLTLPCEFGNATKMNTLANLGASINLMSFSF